MRASNISRRDVYRTYSVVCAGLSVRVPVQDPASYVTRIADAAGVNEAARREALEILSSVDRSEMAGKDPVGLAACALYLACLRRCEVVFRRGIAEAAGVSESTITTGYQSLMDFAPDGR